MRCVSKCFVSGRTIRIYSLLFVGMIFGFSLSTVIQTLDMEAFGSSASLKVQIPLSHHHREASRVSFSNLRSRDSPEEKEQEVGDYVYDRDLETKQGKEDGRRTGGGDVVEPPVVAASPASSMASSELVRVKMEEQPSEAVSGVPVDRLSEELPARQTLLVAVITSVRQLMTQTMAVQGTWAAQAATRVIYFVGDVDTMPHLPKGMEVVKLEGIEDRIENWELKEISVAKYLIDQHLEEALWFMLIGDRTYVATALLEKRLTPLDAGSHVYMGLVDDSENGDSRLCRRDPGVVYSRAVLESLRAYLPMCWPGRGGEGNSLRGCLATLGLQCTRAKEVSECRRVWGICV